MQIKNFMDTQMSRIKSVKSLPSLIVWVLVLVSCVLTFIIFMGIFTYEFNHAFTHNHDHQLYWAVGRGMLNGLKPYEGMYENKPVGIFLISALSFALTNGTLLCNIVSFLSACMLAVMPLWMAMTELKRTANTGIARLKKAAVVFIVFLSGLLLTIYCERRSGGFQIEMIASVFSLLFICFAIKLKKADTRRQRIILTALSAVSISCAVMLKEPFLLVSVFGALLFIDSFGEFWKCIVLPCLIGGAVTVALLAMSGLLVPYFAIYIKQMFATRLSGETSAFTRFFNVSKLGADIRKFSEWHFLVWIASLVLTLLWPVCRKQSLWRAIFHILKVEAALYIACFCVGMGGQYFNHHYIFAAPVYFAFIIFGGKVLYELRYEPKVLKPVLPVVGYVMLMAVCFAAGTRYSTENDSQQFNNVQAAAAYVDEILDFYGEERYQIVGFNQHYSFYGLTKHSPQGPVFVQDPDNMHTYRSWFTMTFLEQIEKSNILVVDSYAHPNVTSEYVENKIETEFTDHPAVKFEKTLSQSFRYKIYFRISKYGQSAEQD